MELRIVARRKSFEYFHPVPFLFLIRRPSVRLWGKRSRHHNNSSTQQQSQRSIFAVTVVVVALGRSLYFISFLAAS